MKTVPGEGAIQGFRPDVLQERVSIEKFLAGQIDRPETPGIFKAGVASVLSLDDEMRVLAFGVLPEQRKRGIDALLLLATHEAASRHGYRRAELSWILEDNVLMRRTVERLGGRLAKRYRLYEAPV